ncbi:MerR family transcriptional regulator [Actinotalea ferrariae]|uniref:MerR family transcriptional regulator n=1 Tax=Actinotalea ferrariae TaxID=1386098 RepID=UPI001C8C2CF4|nr:MerR family transcriptional regulator [Actinotalea ferrariae]MBX9245721.1 MerR family transcriptional regulator [Actinotalea ferrariae]
MPTRTRTEWSIQEVARLTGVTSRTLRHYDAVGLLPPSRVGDNGYRWYDALTLVRLQRVLVLRGLGLPLPAIARALDDEQDTLAALRDHLSRLRTEQERLTRRAASVERTITTLEEGGRLMAEDMFDGFDHTQYKEEVTERWGEDAYASGDRWWRGMSPAEQQVWQERAARLATDWAEAAARGVEPASDEAQALAQRHADWLSGIPGTPGHGTGRPAKEYLVGLGEMYVADERFAKTYGGTEGATFVRDALRVYADSM